MDETFTHLGTNLVTALASLHMNDFTHFDGVRFVVEGLKNKVLDSHVRPAWISNLK